MFKTELNKALILAKEYYHYFCATLYFKILIQTIYIKKSYGKF